MALSQQSQRVIEIKFGSEFKHRHQNLSGSMTNALESLESLSEGVSHYYEHFKHMVPVVIYVH